LRRQSGGFAGIVARAAVVAKAASASEPHMGLFPRAWPRVATHLLASRHNYRFMITLLALDLLPLE
jgi:hypothetical protein